MKKYIIAAVLMLASTSAFADENEFTLTCTGSNFSEYFKISLSEKIKVKWKNGSEPKHVGEDIANEDAIYSCIEKGSDVECIYINRITGNFVFTSGRPCYSCPCNFPETSSWYEPSITKKGRCEVGKIRAF